MSDKLEAPKRIWVDPDEANYYVEMYKFPDDVKYIRADRYTALLEAAVSLHHWLFELKKEVEQDLIDDEEFQILQDAQLALDKWDRLLDDEEE